MRFLADVNISPLTVSWLRKSGYVVERITDRLPATSADITIIEYALKKQATIITQDLDFSALVAKTGARKPSVISLRTDNARPEIINKLLSLLIPEVEKEIRKGAIVSADEKSFRVRMLPIQK